MVAEVNGSFVEDADRLTDEVYHFDTKDRVFEKVDKFVARQKENSQKHVAEKGTEGIQKPKRNSFTRIRVMLPKTKQGSLKKSWMNWSKGFSLF